ncbi:hypothetical protein SAMD00019534_120430 [Acytostelium subglobosum LB1]|uniref:hypothetical protein n=1 Tax=Acytostelium subglobosum LB1 TaxID=1410327 RepID=UPI000644D6C1|nr:hypothetical protein SAMD00019534_120430 [Acytostelium subglobosum LB1]GAM28867.1 hypothetical protein SAMD00019534_120430 [Acytostelium subglobosum LB1]|eukprot:XP_012748239.1 hypothetical protein SAMD00019534_120430 [Acytostelium subglobosum LB1]
MTRTKLLLPVAMSLLFLLSMAMYSVSGDTNNVNNVNNLHNINSANEAQEAQEAQDAKEAKEAKEAQKANEVWINPITLQRQNLPYDPNWTPKYKRDGYELGRELYRRSSQQNIVYVLSPTDQRTLGKDFHMRSAIVQLHQFGLRTMVVSKIEDVPSDANLALVLPKLTGRSKSFFDLLVSCLGYSKEKDYSTQRFFSQVFVFGRPDDYDTFHLDLDLFVGSHKQYHITRHYLKDRFAVQLYVELHSINPSFKWANVYEKMDRLNFPDREVDCTKEHTTIYPIYGWGMYSVLHFLVANAVQGLRYNRMTSIIQGQFPYGPFDKMFIPSSSCDYYDYDAGQLSSLRVEPSGPSKYEKYEIDNGIYVKTFDAVREFITPNTNYTDNRVEKLQFISMLFTYYLTPSFAMRDYMANQVVEVFGGPNQPRCIAIHVRHGDKSRENVVHPFWAYEEVLTANSNKGIRDVFLLTDDQGIIEEAKRSKTDYRFHWIKQQRANNFNINDTAHAPMSLAQDQFDPLNERVTYGMQTFADVYIASRCEMFVGTMTSSVGRSIVEFQTIHYNRGSQSFYSLDGDWDYWGVW